MADRTTTGSALDLPVWCGELDVLDAPAQFPTPPEHARSYRFLVRAQGEPLGYVQGALTAQTTLESLFRQVREELAPPTAAGRPSTEPTGTPALHDVPEDLQVTVAVCTRDRPAELERCLQRLLALRYRALEVLVVDNAPTGTAVADVVARAAERDPRVRYVAEPRPGLSRARNRALTEATGDVLAYTDDDVRVDPWWVHALVRGFGRRDDVGCVTGLVATAGIDTAPEAYFDRRVPWAEVRPHRLYDLDGNRLPDRLYPYAAGIFGTGANFAFRTELVRRLGGFDEALGAGSPARGGEDLDAFVRVLQSGSAISYEPSALVWHHHRSDVAGLRRQMYGYGTGLMAFYTKHLLDRGTRAAFLRSAAHGAGRLVQMGSATRSTVPHAGADEPRGDAGVRAGELVVRELSGMVAGPLLYAAGRRRTGG